MPKLRLSILLAAAISATILLAACGGDDDGDGDTDTTSVAVSGAENPAITEAIETSVKTKDPADCTRLQTQAFLEQTNFSTGEEALADCKEDVKDASNDPRSVTVSGIAVDGASATADVAFIGGPFGGSTVTVELVKEGAQWKLDRIAEIPKLNVASFKQNFTRELKGRPDIPGPIKACIAQRIQRVTEAEVRRTLIGGTEDDLLALFGDCIPPGA